MGHDRVDIAILFIRVMIIFFLPSLIGARNGEGVWSYWGSFFGSFDVGK